MQFSTESKQAFTSEDLEALDLALAGALATVDELGVGRKGREGALRRRLFVLASQGITDPERLQNMVLKSMNVDRTTA